jgi:amino acid transporter
MARNAGRGGAPPDVSLEGGSVGTGEIAFMILAAAAPSAAVVGVVPLGIALGTGDALPGDFLLASLVLLLFAIGYAALSRHVTSAGALYSYVARGLGRMAGASAAYVALVAYNAMAIALAAAFGFFAHGTFDSLFSIDLPWWLWFAASALVVGVLGYREIAITARVLGVALVCELLVLLVFDVAVLLNEGFDGFSLSSFAPASVLGGGVGIALMYAFSSYVGFEAAASYGEEAKDARRGVARATYLALAIIGTFYTLTTCAAIAAYGGHAEAAAAADPGGFVFAAAVDQVGSFESDLLQVLVVSSLFAGFLAFHQGASRYFFAVARDGLLPESLERIHPRHGSPYLASMLQLAIVVVVVGALGLAGLDPYLEITAPTLGLGTLGIIGLQATVSLAVVAFFRRRHDAHWASTLLAPALAAAGLVTSVVLVVDNFDALTGSSTRIVGLLPWIYPLAVLAGLAAAAWLRANRPRRYAEMAANHGIASLGDELSGVVFEGAAR